FAELASGAELLLEQMRDDLGVGLRAEAVSLREEALLQAGVVLDDAVVDDDEAARAVGMRMRVGLRGPSMCRPAGMTEPDAAGHGLLSQPRLEVSDPAGAAPDHQAASIQHG